MIGIRRRTSLPLLALLLPLAAALAGCGGGHKTPAEPAGVDALQIAAISPPSGSTLTGATTVNFAATLDFGLASSGSGMIVLSVEDQNGRLLNAGNQPTTVVPQGTGTVSMAATVVLPVSGVTQLQLSFALVPSAPFATSVAAVATYPVAPAPPPLTPG
jgi:hypothetical protein